MSKKIIVIGAGLGGLSAAALLAKDGHDVTVLEKNPTLGGRAWTSKTKNGYSFDMGPSWYMMPEVYEHFFEQFGKKPSDFYRLTRLDPAYKVITNSNTCDIVVDFDANKKLLANLCSVEPKDIEPFFALTKELYEYAMSSLLYEDQMSYTQLYDQWFIKTAFKHNLTSSYKKMIEKYFSNLDAQHILQFMTVFLGGSPKNIPSIYTLLAHADMGLGIWYPDGGFESVVKAFVSVGTDSGVIYKTDSPVTSIAKTPTGFIVSTQEKEYACDLVVANAEYQFVDQKLLAPENQSYPSTYWKSRKLAPSGIIINLGLTKELKNIAHHTLFFNTDWDKHFADIESRQANTKPLFYIATPSKTDTSVAPKGHENVFILVPQATGATITKKDVEAIRNYTVKKISEQAQTDIEKLIDYEEIYTNQYFVDYFNADRGNAFGLSHTTLQSSIRRPPIRHKKLKGLYFTGQFTNPGTGAPLVTISGEVVRNAIKKDYS